MKRKRISQIISNSKVDVFLTQESKLAFVNSSMINSLWSKEKVGWLNTSVNGRLGGLITKWREGFREEIFNFKGLGYLGVKVCRRGQF